MASLAAGVGLSSVSSIIGGASMMKNIAGGASLASGALGSLSSSSSGNQQAAIYSSQASQLRTQANNVNASAQQQAHQQVSQANQAESTALAQTAGSGVSAGSVSAVNNRANIAEKGELNSLTTLWNGEEQANQLKDQANVLDAQAKSTKSAGGLGSLSSILSAGTSLYKIYG